ncbi:MAG: diacylglycerol kinase family protein [Alphaproteobacteria bacterium]
MDTLFLVNPDSQTVKTKGSLLARVNTSGDHVIDYVTDFKNLPKLMKHAAKSNCQYICIEGGDGTAHGVMTAYMQARKLFKQDPSFMLIPGGMTNQVAGNIGVKKKTVKHVETLLETGRKTVHETRLLKLDIDGASAQFGFLFSTGGIPSATDYCKEKMHGRGIGGSAAVAATILRGVAGSRAIRDEMMPPTPVALSIHKQNTTAKINTSHLASLVTTLPGLMLGLDPFWGKGDDPVRLTFAHDGARNLLPHMLSILMGRKNKDRSKDGIESFTASALEYAYNGPAVLDGESITLPNGRLSITATPPVNFVS